MVIDVISIQVAPFSVPAVYVSSILCMVSLRCIIALFYELLMEVWLVLHLFQTHSTHLKIMPHFIMPQYIHFSAALPKISRGIWKEYSLTTLIDFIPQVHYPVPESLASLAWGQAGRLLSAIFLGMFRCLSTLSLTEMIIISCQLGGGWDCRGGELDELLPGHLHRSASRPTYDGQGQNQN